MKKNYLKFNAMAKKSKLGQHNELRLTERDQNINPIKIPQKINEINVSAKKGVDGKRKQECNESLNEMKENNQRNSLERSKFDINIGLMNERKVDENKDNLLLQIQTIPKMNTIYKSYFEKKRKGLQEKFTQDALVLIDDLLDNEEVRKVFGEARKKSGEMKVSSKRKIFEMKQEDEDAKSDEKECQENDIQCKKDKRKYKVNSVAQQMKYPCKQNNEKGDTIWNQDKSEEYRIEKDALLIQKSIESEVLNRDFINSFSNHQYPDEKNKQLAELNFPMNHNDITQDLSSLNNLTRRDQHFINENTIIYSQNQPQNFSLQNYLRQPLHQEYSQYPSQQLLRTSIPHMFDQRRSFVDQNNNNNNNNINNNNFVNHGRNNPLKDRISEQQIFINDDIMQNERRMAFPISKYFDQYQFASINQENQLQSHYLNNQQQQEQQQASNYNNCNNIQLPQEAYYQRKEQLKQLQQCRQLIPPFINEDIERIKHPCFDSILPNFDIEKQIKSYDQFDSLNQHQHHYRYQVNHQLNPREDFVSRKDFDNKNNRKVFGQIYDNQCQNNADINNNSRNNLVNY